MALNNPQGLILPYNQIGTDQMNIKQCSLRTQPHTNTQPHTHMYTYMQ